MDSVKSNHQCARHDEAFIAGVRRSLSSPHSATRASGLHIVASRPDLSGAVQSELVALLRGSIQVDWSQAQSVLRLLQPLHLSRTQLDAVAQLLCFLPLDSSSWAGTAVQTSALVFEVFASNSRDAQQSTSDALLTLLRAKLFISYIEDTEHGAALSRATVGAVQRCGLEECKAYRCLQILYTYHLLRSPAASWSSSVTIRALFLGVLAEMSSWTGHARPPYDCLQPIRNELEGALLDSQMRPEQYVFCLQAMHAMGSRAFGQLEVIRRFIFPAENSSWWAAAVQHTAIDAVGAIDCGSDHLVSLLDLLPAVLTGPAVIAVLERLLSALQVLCCRVPDANAIRQFFEFAIHHQLSVRQRAVEALQQLATISVSSGVVLSECIEVLGAPPCARFTTAGALQRFQCSVALHALRQMNEELVRPYAALIAERTEAPEHIAVKQEAMTLLGTACAHNEQVTPVAVDRCLHESLAAHGTAHLQLRRIALLAMCNLRPAIIFRFMDSVLAACDMPQQASAEEPGVVARHLLVCMYNWFQMVQKQRVAWIVTQVKSAVWHLPREVVRDIAKTIFEVAPTRSLPVCGLRLNERTNPSSDTIQKQVVGRVPHLEYCI